AMQVFNPFRHSMGGAGARGADLQHTLMNLGVKREDMATHVRGHIIAHEDIPELIFVFVTDLTLIRASVAIDRVYRMMAENQLMSGRLVLLKCRFQPIGLDMPFTPQPAPECMNEHHQEIVAANPIGQACLSGRTVARELQYLTENSLAHLAVGGVVS